MSDEELFIDLIANILCDSTLTGDVAEELKVTKGTLKRWGAGTSLPEESMRFVISLKIAKVLLDRIEYMEETDRYNCEDY